MGDLGELCQGAFLIDLSAAAVFTGCTRDSLRNHHQRGHLRAVGRDRRGRNLYALGDLLVYRVLAEADDEIGEGWGLLD